VDRGALHAQQIHDVGELRHAGNAAGIGTIDDEKRRGGGVGGYNPVTFVGGIRPAPCPIADTQNIDGRTEVGAVRVWLTPHGFKGAAANLGTAKVTTAHGKKAVSFTAFGGKYTVTGTINAQNLLEHVETLMGVAFTGDTLMEGNYSAYKDFGGVKFPLHIVMKEGGYPTLDLTVAEVKPNGAPALEAREARLTRWCWRESAR
jgi:hypothetical protein